LPEVRLVCVDDHRLMLQGIELILSSEPNMTVVATGTSAEEAVALYREHRPDIIVVDLNLGTSNGIDAIRAIKSEDANARIIVLTMLHGDDDIHAAFQAGATSYLLKDTLSSHLLETIKAVSAGERPIDEVVRKQLAASREQRHLTAREIQILELVAHGQRNKEIAAVLGIERVTVEVHIRNIFEKLEVNDRTAAVTTGIRKGIIRVL
jgi:DNA-binding NarL/FixJ family response regulator